MKSDNRVNKDMMPAPIPNLQVNRKSNEGEYTENRLVDPANLQP